MCIVREVNLKIYMYTICNRDSAVLQLKLQLQWWSLIETLIELLIDLLIKCFERGIYYEYFAAQETGIV